MGHATGIYAAAAGNPSPGGVDGNVYGGRQARREAVQVAPPVLHRAKVAAVRPAGADPVDHGLAGGGLGTLIGVRPTLVVAAAGGCVSVLWVVFSPLFGMRDFPTDESDALEALMLRESGVAD